MRTEFVGHVRATLAYLEENRETIRAMLDERKISDAVCGGGEFFAHALVGERFDCKLKIALTRRVWSWPLRGGERQHPSQTIDAEFDDVTSSLKSNSLNHASRCGS
jgi:hypothetical protein